MTTQLGWTIAFVIGVTALWKRGRLLMSATLIRAIRLQNLSSGRPLPDALSLSS